MKLHRLLLGCVSFVLLATTPADAQLQYEGVENATRTPAVAQVEPATGPLANCTHCRVYVLPLQGEVESALRHVVRRGIAEAEAGDYDLLLLDMDTYGGQLYAAVEITEMLTDCRLPTATYVNRKAISAGALISFSTLYIGMADGGMIGASTPVSSGGEEMSASVEEKINSVVRAKFRTLAEENSHPVDLAEAMVDRRVVIPGLVGDDQLLTLTAKQAVTWDLAYAETASLEAFVRTLGAQTTTLTRLETSPYEAFARLISSSTVSGMLITLALLCIYFEIRTPGIGVPGALGALLFLLFFFGNYIARLSGFGAVLLLLLGMALVMIELFVTPGFGVVGGAGLLAMMVACILALLDVPLDSELFTLASLVRPMVTVSAAFVVFLVLVAITLVATPKAATLVQLTLDAVQRTDDGYRTGGNQTGLARGQRGIALTPLHPGGLAEFDGQEVHVVSVGPYVERHAPVRIVETGGFRITVEPEEG